MKREQYNIIYIDHSKAFDSVDHQILLGKLSEMRLSIQLYINWFKSYLVDRTVQMKLNNTISTNGIIIKGIPQGSQLGPLLFKVYIND